MPKQLVKKKTIQTTTTQHCKLFGARRLQISTVIISGFERKHSGTHSENPAALRRAAVRRLFSDVLKLFDSDP